MIVKIEIKDIEDLFVVAKVLVKNEYDVKVKSGFNHKELEIDVYDGDIYEEEEE